MGVVAIDDVTSVTDPLSIKLTVGVLERFLALYIGTG
jgi:hypothetical protein